MARSSCAEEVVWVTAENTNYVSSSYREGKHRVTGHRQEPPSTDLNSQERKIRETTREYMYTVEGRTFTLYTTGLGTR